MAISTASHQNDSASVLSEETVRTSSNAASSSTSNQESSQYTLVRHTFEEDLQKSWVYQRSTDRDSRISITSSIQFSLSWSMLSGLSLSKISNIAVQSLPIFEKDLHNSGVYKFENSGLNDTKAETITTFTYPPGTNKKAIDMEWWPEFCLACDKQTDGSVYCSEACRLIEHEATTLESKDSDVIPPLTELKKERLRQYGRELAIRREAHKRVPERNLLDHLQRRATQNDSEAGPGPRSNVPKGSEHFQDPKPPKNLNASSVRHWPAPPKPSEFAFLSSFHIPQASRRFPVIARKHVKKSSISSPKLVSSSYMHNAIDTGAPI